MVDGANKELELQYVEQAFKENEKIRGNLGELGDGRLVFIGERADEKNAWFIAFRNAEGRDTRLCLSKEAMALLVRLYNKHPKSDDIFPMRVQMAWQVTVEAEAEA